MRGEDPVPCRRRHALDVAHSETPLAARHDDAERALEHLVAFLLTRVQVVAHGEAARHELELVLEHLASGLCRGTEKDEPVARCRILEHVPSTRHGASLPLGEALRPLGRTGVSA